MTVKMAATFKNGRHENIILQMMFIFQNDGNIYTDKY